MNDERELIQVDAHALHEVLVALNGPPRPVLELMALRGWPDNAITVLSKSFNAAVAAREATAKALSNGAPPA